LTADPAALKLKRLPNSVDTLAPNNRFVVAINKIPMTKQIPYHSIIGDRGRGDTPNSSDGVVPYWSSHLDGAKSEKIVPSDHGANQNPEAIAEVIRILKEHIAGKSFANRRSELRGAETRYDSPSTDHVRASAQMLNILDLISKFPGGPSNSIARLATVPVWRTG